MFLCCLAASAFLSFFAHVMGCRMLTVSPQLQLQLMVRLTRTLCFWSPCLILFVKLVLRIDTTGTHNIWHFVLWTYNPLRLSVTQTFIIQFSSCYCRQCWSEKFTTVDIMAWMQYKAPLEMTSGGFRPGPGEGGLCPPPSLLQAPQFRGHPWFFAKITQVFDFFAFPNFLKTGQICGFHWTSKNQKGFSFRGLYSPDLLTRGCAPGPHWGLCLQTPIIGSRYCARHQAGAMPPRHCGLERPLEMTLILHSYRYY